MSRPRTTALAASALAVLLLTAGCGGDDDPSEDAAAALEAAASAAAAALSAAPDALDDPSGEASAEPTEEASEPVEDGGSEDEGPCVTDSSAPSGTSTISFAADTAAAESSGKVAEVQADGTLEPSALSVAVGEVFAVRGPASGLLAVEIGCAGGQTLPPGDLGAWTISTPGTYPMVDSVTGDVLGSVSVR